MTQPKDTRIGPNPSGLCMCGCGQPTPLAGQTHVAIGHIAGQPVKFLYGHHLRKSPVDWIEEDRGYTTPCWIWQGTVGKRNGYGRSWHNGKMTNAHVAVYERQRGPMPKGMVLDHLCRVRQCVNPDHMEPVTHAENCRRGECARLTHADVVEIRRLTDSMTPLELSAKYGVSRAHIYNIINRKKWV